MNNSGFIRLSGWLMILGAIAFLPGAIGMLYESQTIDWNTPPMQLAAFAVFSAPVLLAVGMLGLRARYKIGGGVLLFGVIIGGLLVVVGTLVQFLTPDYSVSETYYGVWLGGVLVLNICLSIFGVLALIQKPLPRWNALPLLAGVWIPLLPVLGGIVNRYASPVESLLVLVIVGLVVTTIAQVMLGYILQAGTSPETATI
jgi:hypothetical protein